MLLRVLKTGYNAESSGRRRQVGGGENVFHETCARSVSRGHPQLAAVSAIIGGEEGAITDHREIAWPGTLMPWTYLNTGSLGLALISFICLQEVEFHRFEPGIAAHAGRRQIARAGAGWRERHRATTIQTPQAIRSSPQTPREGARNRYPLQCRWFPRERVLGSGAPP